MTDTTQAPDYWALLEEITEYRGHLIQMANAIYTLIDAETRRGDDQGTHARGLHIAGLEAEPAASEDAAEWLAPVIPLRARRA